MAINYYEQKNLPVTANVKKKRALNYKPSTELIDALNVSLELGMPLILTGEPGTGKTDFAHHVSERFELGEVLVFNAKTTSTASDLFYRYQAVKHFQYIQNLKNLSEKDKNTSKSTEDFIEYQALGKAIKKAQSEGKRSVVLIDEVDKAPRDFPNDILNELEYLKFDVPELDASFEAPDNKRPIIILTSNSEKNLPAPFLRRCVYYNIDFPNAADLLEIITLKMKDTSFDSGTMANTISEFEIIRDIAKRNNTKQPATAEFISWIAVLQKLKVDTNTFKTPKADKKKLLQSYRVLAKSEELIKVLEDRLDKWIKNS